MEEIWKDVIGFEGKYQVSNTGKVKSLERIIKRGEKGDVLIKTLVLKNRLSKKGYHQVILYKKGIQKQFTVHQLVSIMFLENKDSFKEVNHINGIKTDNFSENLEWCSRGHNMRHALRTGLKIPRNGESINTCKLTKSQAAEIKYSDKSIQSRFLSNKFKVSMQTVWKIRAGKSWNHI